jgi:hypothetical protein
MSEQVTQLLGQLAHLPFMRILPEPHPATHVPKLRVIPLEQEVQPLGPDCEQVAQEESQDVQSW